LWSALTSGEKLPAGCTVTVESVSGLTLTVRMSELQSH
jgi:membrane protein implicated in regulation of membrane protease activity